MTREWTETGLHHIRLRAMNTQIEAILAGGTEEAVIQAETLIRSWFRQKEERFSRFLSDSELSRLNGLAGEICLVSDDMLEIAALSEIFRRETGGLFHPLMLKALRDAGYDRTFEAVKERGSFQAEVRPSEREMISARFIDIDPIMKSIRLPERTEMDLGGIVKGWAVLRLGARLRNDLGLQRGLVNAGGDLTVWGGVSASGEPWVIGIESPWRPEADAGMIALLEGSVATSSTIGRRWPTSAGIAHHLIDPRTMLPSDSDVVQCTVAGPDAARCEVWAKAICIAGSEEGTAIFARRAPDYEALLFTKDGRTVYCGPEHSIGTRWLGLNPDSVIRPPAA